MIHFLWNVHLVVPVKSWEQAITCLHWFPAWKLHMQDSNYRRYVLIVQRSMHRTNKDITIFLSKQIISTLDTFVPVSWEYLAVVLNILTCTVRYCFVLTDPHRRNTQYKSNSSFSFTCWEIFIHCNKRFCDQHIEHISPLLATSVFTDSTCYLSWYNCTVGVLSRTSKLKFKHFVC